MNTPITEMSLSRVDTIDRCMSLGKQFAEHFNVICKESTKSLNFKHHCHDMQVWFDTVLSIRIKPKGKHLTVEQLVDWFFTSGQNIEDIIDEDYQDIYDVLIRKLVSNDQCKIIDIMSDILNTF